MTTCALKSTSGDLQSPALATCLLLHLLVGQVGLEPTMSLTTDLQSAALPILLTDPYLTYIMDYIIFCCVCQVFFLVEFSFIR